MKFVLPIKEYQQFKPSSCTAELSMKFSLLMNNKMPTTVGILIFLAGKISCSAELSMKKSFMTSEPDVDITVSAEKYLLSIYI